MQHQDRQRLVTRGRRDCEASSLTKCRVGVERDWGSSGIEAALVRQNGIGDDLARIAKALQARQ